MWHFFDEGIRSRESAWALGIAYGDGSIATQPSGKATRNITGFRIKLQLTDVNVLNNLTKMLESGHFISVSWPTSVNCRHRPAAEVSTIILVEHCTIWVLSKTKVTKSNSQMKLYQMSFYGILWEDITKQMGHNVYILLAGVPFKFVVNMKDFLMDCVILFQTLPM